MPSGQVSYRSWARWVRSLKPSDASRVSKLHGPNARWQFVIKKNTEQRMVLLMNLTWIQCIYSIYICSSNPKTEYIMSIGHICAHALCWIDTYLSSDSTKAHSNKNVKPVLHVSYCPKMSPMLGAQSTLSSLFIFSEPNLSETVCTFCWMEFADSLVKDCFSQIN